MDKLQGWKITKNQLKMIAAIAMLIDHVGAEIFPQYGILRIVGRIAFPIFSYSIYEGAKYTHSQGKYFFRILLLGLLCLLGYYIYDGEIYGNVLITFSLSLLIIYSVQFLKRNCGNNLYLTMLGIVLVCSSIIGAIVVCHMIYIDYGFVGVLLPVFAEILDTHEDSPTESEKWIPLLGFSIGTILLSIRIGGIQYFSILGLLFLAMSGERKGKYQMKYFFYLFYPIHLLMIGGIAAMRMEVFL